MSELCDSCINKELRCYKSEKYCCRGYGMFSDKKIEKPIFTARCHYEKLSEYLNAIGEEDILYIIPNYCGSGEYFYTIIHTANIDLKE